MDANGHDTAATWLHKIYFFTYEFGYNEFIVLQYLFIKLFKARIKIIKALNFSCCIGHVYSFST